MQIGKCALRISILIGYRVFLTSKKKIVLSFCSQYGRRAGEGAKWVIYFLCRKEVFFE